MRFRRESARRALASGAATLAAALTAGALVACGDDGEEPRAVADVAPIYGVAAEPPGPFVERLAKLLETTTEKRQCAQLDDIMQRSYARFPCPPEPDLRASMARFAMVDAEAYGTGAVADYKSGTAKDGAAILMFVGPDRNWGVSRFGMITPPSVGTSDADSRAGFVSAVDAYLQAVRDRDCKAYVRSAFTDGRKGQEVCRGQFVGTEDLAKRMKADPSARPRYMGGNAVYGFFSLETSKPKPESSTISVVKGGSGSDSVYDVVDVAPSPTSAAQRDARQRLREALRDRRPPGMAPASSSKKPLDHPDEP
jgi:hypothetical protein